MLKLFACSLFCNLIGTDISLWHGKTGKNLGLVDTNQLKNTMATVSPNGRFIAAAAFTADVKVVFHNISMHWLEKNVPFMLYSFYF